MRKKNLIKLKLKDQELLKQLIAKGSQKSANNNTKPDIVNGK